MFTIYTWGYGKAVWEMLRSVSFFVQNEYYMLAVAFTGMLFMLAIRYFKTEHLDYKAFLLAVAMVWLFLKPSPKTFNIVDEATGYGTTISNIPLGIGLLLSLESNLERAMLAKTESSFSTPNSVSFRNAGMGFSFIAPLEIMDAEPADEYLQLTFTHWMNNCMLYDISMGNVDLNRITVSTDLITDLSSIVNFETLVFDSANPDGVEQDCRTAWNTIKNRLGNEANNYLNNTLPARLNMTGSPNFAGALSGTQQLIHQASANSLKWIEQEMMRNMLDKGFKATATMTGGELATTAWSAAVAKASTNQTWRMTGQQAKNNLPVVRVIGTALLIGVSVIVAFYAAASFSMKAFFMVMAGFFTLGLWSPIAAIINYQVYRRAEDMLPPAFGSLSNADQGLENIATYAANLEWWYGAIPMISYMLITGGGMGAMYLMRDAAAGSGAGSGAGIDSAKGNFNYGNENVGNSTYNERRANHESFVDGVGDHSNMDTGGGFSTRMTGIDGAGGGFMATSARAQGGGNMLKVDNAAGSSAITYGQDGSIVNASYSNPSLTNSVGESTNARVTTAAEERDQAGKSFATDIASKVAEMSGSGTNIVDTDTLVDNFGVDATTAKSIQATQREAQTKAFIDSLTEAQKAELERKFGNNWTAKVGGELSLGLMESGSGGKAGAGGEITGFEIEDKKSGTTYTGSFDSKQQEQYERSFEERFGESLASKNGVLLQLGRGITQNESDVDTKTKEDALRYSEATEHLESLSTRAEQVRMMAKENAADLNGQLLREYIEQDPTLHRKWENARGDKQRAAVISTAQSEIQRGTLRPAENPVEAAKVQDALDTVISRYGRQGVADEVQEQIDGVHIGNPEDGKAKIENEKIKRVDPDKERVELHKTAGDRMSDVYTNQDPTGKREFDTKKFDKIHNVMGADLDAQVKKAEERGAGDPGEQKPVETYADRTRESEEAWERAEKDGLLKQVGIPGLGSKWQPGDNFEKKVENYSVEDLRNLQIQHSQTGLTGYAMNDELQEKIKDAISKKAAQEAINGNFEHIDLINKGDLKEAFKKSIGKDRD